MNTIECTVLTSRILVLRQHKTGGEVPVSRHVSGDIPDELFANKVPDRVISSEGENTQIHRSAVILQMGVSFSESIQPNMK